MLRTKVFKLVVFFLFCCSYHFTVSAQENYIDSLEQIVQTEQPDSLTLAKTYSYLIQIFRSNTDTTFYYLDHADRMAREAKDTGRMSHFHYFRAWIYKLKEDYRNCLRWNMKAVDVLGDMGFEERRALALYQIGMISNRMGRYEEAIRAYNQSMQLFRGLNDQQMLYRCYNNLGIVYKEVEDYDLALYYFKRAIQQSEDMGTKAYIPYLNISNIEKAKGNYKKGLQILLDAKAMSDSTNVDDQLLLDHNIAVTYENMDMYAKAKPIYKKNLQISYHRDRHDLMKAMWGYGNMSWRTGDYKTGEAYLDSALHLAKELEELENVKNILFSKTILYQFLDRDDEALDYLFRVYYLNDTLLSAQKNERITELREFYEAERREAEIALLAAENELKESELQREKEHVIRMKLQVYVFIAIALLVAGLLLYTWHISRIRKRNYRELHRKNVEIEQQKEAIGKKNKELERANQVKDKLFQIVAHDLRSPLISLDNISRLIPFWLEEKDYESLESMAKNMHTSVERLLGLIDDLLNWSLSNAGEIPYHPETVNLKKLGMDTLELYQILAESKKIQLINDLPDDLAVYADKNMLKTVMRNLVNNAVKYTPSNGEIRIKGECENGTTCLCVEDTGQGIPRDKLKQILHGGDQDSKAQLMHKGLGLFFCKEFVKINRGTFDIESEEGKGTSVKVELPSAKA